MRRDILVRCISPCCVLLWLAAGSDLGAQSVASLREGDGLVTVVQSLPQAADDRSEGGAADLPPREPGKEDELGAENMLEGLEEGDGVLEGVPLLPAEGELPDPPVDVPEPPVDLPVPLPTPEPWWADVDGEDDLFAGEPDVFTDLDVVPLADDDVAVLAEEAFDDAVLQGELIATAYQPPLERQGFRLGMGVQAIYDSNVYLDPGNEVSDLSFLLSPSIEYRSAPAGVPGVVALRYTPFIRMHLEETDLNTVNHSASASVSFTGARGRFSVAADYGRFSHADRQVGGRRESESMGVRAEGLYEVGARTMVEASLSARISRDSDPGRPGVAPTGTSEEDSLHFQCSGYWQATPKTRLGPSLRYSRSDADRIGDRDALALLLVADHEARDGVVFSASLGIERVGGGSDFDADTTGLTGSFGVIYRLNDRIALEGDISYQAIPEGSHRLTRSGGGERSFTGGIALRYTPHPDWVYGIDVRAEAYPSLDSANYVIADQTYTASVTRRLPQGAVTLAGTVGVSDYAATGPVTEVLGEDEFRQLSLLFRRPVLSERGEFHSSVQWSDSSGNRDWERWQFAVGLNWTF